MSVKKQSPIGARFPKANAADMVTGHAAYGADINLPGTLHAAILRSPHGHARIKSLNTRRAEEMPGVLAVVTARDFPKTMGKDVRGTGETGIELDDLSMTVLARDKVLFDGHPIAAVAAADPYTARDALDLIEVKYEVLPPVTDCEGAMKPDAPLVHEKQFTTDTMGVKIADKPSNVARMGEMGWGDIEKGFAQADVIVEETYRASMAHQAYIEPHACTAEVTSDGKVNVWTSTQGSFAVQGQISVLLNLLLKDIRVTPTEVGGAFGGKIIVIIEPVAVLLARKAGRPVKLVMSRDESLKATGPGSPTVIRIKAGCKKNGKITAIEARLIYDAGCVKGSGVWLGANTAFAPYKIPHLSVETLDVVTNKPHVHAYRAPGAPQAAFAMEQHVDQMAAAIKMDPLEFRKKNAVSKGDKLSSGILLPKIGLKQLLKKVEESDHWKSRLTGRNTGRGLAVGFWFNAGMSSAASVKLHRDETATLIVGSVDITGTRTAFKQFCAESLGIEPERVAVEVGDTAEVGYTDVSGGSRTVYSTGMAVQQACEDLMDQYTGMAAKRLKARKEKVAFKEGVFYVKGDRKKQVPLAELLDVIDATLVGTGSVANLPFCKAPAYSADLVDVEVDPETGKVAVLKITTFQDVGKAINPTRVEAQMQGGAIQGLGWGLTEEYIYDKDARLRNPTLLDYRLLTALDLPPIGAEIVEVPSEDGPYGVRGVGEAPIVPPAAALANAVANAAGVRVTHMPLTPERVFWAIREKSRKQGKKSSS